MQTSRLSTKGQVTLPKSIRAARAWTPGTEFVVEETREGVLLRPTARTPLDQVAGYLAFRGKAKTIPQMNAAIRREVKRRHTRGRY